MSFQDLLYAVEDKVATITLNRPERMNALSHALEAEIHRAFDAADADREVRAIILTGSGAACGRSTRPARVTPNTSNSGSASMAAASAIGSICGSSASR
jgi:1,4-dihydroxy-2-naphthoyl-CoA synthase